MGTLPGAMLPIPKFLHEDSPDFPSCRDTGVEGVGAGRRRGTRLPRPRRGAARRGLAGGGPGDLGAVELHHLRHRYPRRGGVGEVDGALRHPVEGGGAVPGTRASRRSEPEAPSSEARDRGSRAERSRERRKSSRSSRPGWRARMAGGSTVRRRWVASAGTFRRWKRSSRRAAIRRRFSTSGRDGTDVAAPLRKDYVRYVELANEGARELGFEDVGAMWRSKYDMPPDEFAKELDRLWEQVKPLYVSLHAYVRRRLVETYGKELVPADGLIPAHLLGNMWAQQWGNVYPLVAPEDADPGYDLTERLKAKGRRASRDVPLRREVFSSRSASSPFPRRSGRDRSSSNRRTATWSAMRAPGTSTAKNDLRIKMCTNVTAEDFVTIHHELGHNFYQRAYSDLSPLYRDSANDGFHEAIGDTVALSMTPRYLKELGLIDTEPPALEGHRPSPPDGARQGGLSPVRPSRRPVALEGVLGRGAPGDATTRRGGSSERSIRASRRPSLETRRISIPPPSTTSPRAFPTRGTSSPTFSSSSFTARFARSSATRALSTAAPSTRARRPGRSSTRC